MRFCLFQMSFEKQKEWESEWNKAENQRQTSLSAHCSRIYGQLAQCTGQPTNRIQQALTDAFTALLGTAPFIATVARRGFYFSVAG